jgi:hypothetical protein
LPRPCCRAREAARTALPRSGPVFSVFCCVWVNGSKLKEREMVAAAVAFQGALCVCVFLLISRFLGDFSRGSRQN